MTDQERKAMEMALEALEHVDRFDLNRRFCFDEEIDDLRTALAQNPLDIADRAYFAGKKDGIAETLAQGEQEPAEYDAPALYKAKSEREQTEYDKAFEKEFEQYAESDEGKARNKAAQSEQEPVAWQNKELPDEFYDYKLLDPSWYSHYRPLYAAPPSKPWVGLTDEEIKGILDCGRGGLVDIKKAEQILKEKNA